MTTPNNALYFMASLSFLVVVLESNRVTTPHNV